MKDTSNLYISKLDVARRELDHALRLFLNKGDIVIIHLVISACGDVLEGISGKSSGIRQEFKRRIKPDKLAYVMGKIKHAYNFFKHADRDSKEILEFNPEISEFFLLDAIEMYQSVTGEVTGLMVAFRAWFFLKNPNLLIDEEQKKLYSNTNFDINNRLLFLQLAEQIENKRTGN